MSHDCVKVVIVSSIVLRFILVSISLKILEIGVWRRLSVEEYSILHFLCLDGVFDPSRPHELRSESRRSVTSDRLVVTFEPVVDERTQSVGKTLPDGRSNGQDRRYDGGS